MVEIPLSRCFNQTLLLILCQPNILQPLVHIESEVLFAIIVLPPFSNEFLLSLLSLSGQLWQGLGKKSEQVALHRLLSWVASSN